MLEIPRLTLVTDQDGEIWHHSRYELADKNAFQYEHWVPTLLDVKATETYGQQKEVLTGTLVKVAASQRSLRESSVDRARFSRNLWIDARFGLDETSLPRLRYLRIGRAAIGYQTPDEDCPNPAFAVIDGREDTVLTHEVIHHPDELLGDAATQVSDDVYRFLRDQLDSLYPGFNLIDKLNSALEEA